MTRPEQPIYPIHRLHTLEPYYSRHVSAMTELPGKQKGLHAKSDIAAQLAWRDQAIDRLKSELATLQAKHDVALNANHEAWKDGMGVGYKAGTDPLWIPPENPFPKPARE